MTRRFVTLLMLAAATCAFVACNGSTSPTKGEDVPSLLTTDTIIGTGAVAVNGKIVTVHYTFWLYASAPADHHGARLESSRDSGQPISFVLGTGGVIRGWDLGIPGMKVGGQRTLIIPSSQGYGPNGNGNVPGSSALVFDIELLDVR